MPSSRPERQRSSRAITRSLALRITAIYAVFAILWIYFSDRALEGMLRDPQRVVEWSTYKGAAFVLVTSTLLFLVMHRVFGALEVRQRKLRESQELLASIVGSAMDAIVSTDEAGRIVTFNPAAERIFACPAAQAIGGPLERFVPELRSECQRGPGLLRGHTATGAAVALEVTSALTGPEGARRCMLILRDATQRLAHEDELAAAEATARAEKLFSDAMLESMPGVVYFYDDQGRFVRWNRNFADVSGYSSNEIARMHPLDFIAETDRPVVGPRIAEVFEHGASQVEAPLATRDGRAIPYLFTGRRVTHEGSNWLVGVGVDISERVNAERALRTLNETLEQRVAKRTVELQAARVRAEAADRLKSAFLANMSHELRTPLNSIIGFTGIMLKGMAGPLTAEQEKQLGMVRGSARHLLALINDVLDLSKIEAGQMAIRPEPLDIATCVEKVAGAVKPLAEKKGLRIDTRIAPGHHTILADPRRVEQILLNLLSNAIKFTNQGGVTVSLESVDEQVPEGAGVRLRVADTGVGIRAEDLSQLFLPFQQLDAGLARQHEGTGLGLSICRRLAALMGGEVLVASEWGKGSVFTLLLPAAATASAP